MLCAASRRTAVSARSTSSRHIHGGNQSLRRRRVLVTRSSAKKRTPVQRFSTPVLVWSDDILEMCTEFLPEASAKSFTSASTSPLVRPHSSSAMSRHLTNFRHPRFSALTGGGVSSHLSLASRPHAVFHYARGTFNSSSRRTL